jgi:phosphoribosylanthranilate isomerase
VADLRDRLPDRVDLIAAVEAGDPDAPGHAAAADALLVDASDADGGGGTGRTVDWGAARDLRDRIDAPLVLAGGLTPGTVRDAVAAVDPYAVDVASGVERTPGRKDHDAVERFVAAAREPADGAAAARGRTTGGSP